MALYALHGFDVTSIEFLPLKGATIALQQLAPQVRLLDGDGSKLLPKLVGTLSPAAAARTTWFVFETYAKVMGSSSPSQPGIKPEYTLSFC